VAPARDQSEIGRFARATEGYEKLITAAIAKLEPDLAGRFDAALFYKSEAHMGATLALSSLLEAARAAGVVMSFGEKWPGTKAATDDSVVIDCRGYAAREDLKNLRGVRGERLVLETREVALSRPVRLIHPRQPIYVVPQGNGRFVVGATVIEREDDSPMTVRSALELLGSAYALHPAFGEAAIIDMGAGVRPAFPDNVPRAIVDKSRRVIRVNGAYRHGFLLAPVLAEAVVAFVHTGSSHALIVAG
jgi:glycine oxidase